MKGVFPKKPRGIKWLLALVVAGAIGVVAAIFIGYSVSDDPELLTAMLKSQADASLGAIRHTATRDGVKEWTLEAESAQFTESEQRLEMKNISLVYFLENGNEVHVFAKGGVLHAESNDIDVFGDVVVKHDPYVLKTQKLGYRHRQRLLFSEMPVEITHLQSYLSAEGMVYDLDAHQVKFKSDIEVIWDEALQM